MLKWRWEGDVMHLSGPGRQGHDRPGGRPAGRPGRSQPPASLMKPVIEQKIAAGDEEGRLSDEARAPDRPAADLPADSAPARRRRTPRSLAVLSPRAGTGAGTPGAGRAGWRGGRRSCPLSPPGPRRFRPTHPVLRSWCWTWRSRPRGWCPRSGSRREGGGLGGDRGRRASTSRQAPMHRGTRAGLW